MSHNDSEYIRATWYPHQNWGDNLNAWMINKLSGGKLAMFCRQNDGKSKVACIGSILQLIDKDTTVWGAGVISRRDKIIKDATYLAVRGPVSRDMIISAGGDCPEVYGDPALLMPSMYTPQENTQRYKVGILPHYIDQQSVQVVNPEYKYIDVCSSITDFIDQLSQCDCVVTSSLHGIIACHAYQIPVKWVKFSDKLYGDDVKFDDYFASIGHDTPVPLDWTDPQNININQAIDSMKHTTINLDLQPLIDCCPLHPNE